MSSPLQNPTSQAVSPQGERIFSVASAIFCATLVISNVLAAKTLDFGMLTLPASILTFPIVYMINDCLSDVFGFKRMRVIIVTGFTMAAVAAAAFHLAIFLPGLNPETDAAFAQTLGSSWRILLAAFCSYLSGSLLNSFLMVRLKTRFEKNLLFRCMASTIVGETVDSCVFITIAFAFVYGWDVIGVMIVSQIALKSLYELILYPVTRRVIMKLREAVMQDVNALTR